MRSFRGQPHRWLLLLRIRRVRVVEIEFVAIEIANDHEPVSPKSIFHIYSLVLEFGAESVEHIDIERDEYEPAAHFVRPLRRQDERAALALDLRHKRLPFFLVTPALHKP